MAVTAGVAMAVRVVTEAERKVTMGGGEAGAALGSEVLVEEVEPAEPAVARMVAMAVVAVMGARLRDGRCATPSRGL